MFAKERQDLILQQVNQQGRVKVKDLSQQFKVTEDCIRKDLSRLENAGLLKKAYGGAVKLKHNPHLYRSEDRKHQYNEERQMIAKKSLQCIKEGDVIFLDISLSNIELAQLIIQSQIQVTVITNMVEILNVLIHSSIQVIFIGGLLNSEHDGFYSSLSVQMIQSFKIDKAFLGAVGIDLDTREVTTYHIEDGIMKSHVIKQSQQTYILCETHKFQEFGHYVYATLDDVNAIIVSDEEHHNQDEQITMI